MYKPTRSIRICNRNKLWWRTHL